MDQVSNFVLIVFGFVVEFVFNVFDCKNVFILVVWVCIFEFLVLFYEVDDVWVCVVKGVGGKVFCVGVDILEFEVVWFMLDVVVYYDQVNVIVF